MEGARDTEFRLLGSVEAVVGGQPVALGGIKQRALLAALLLDANSVVSTARLTEALWGEDAPATAAKTLQVYVSRLRHELESANGAGGSRLVTRAPGYVLEVAPDEVDLLRFERLAAEARESLGAGRPAQAADQLRAALALWRGPALADLDLEPVARLAAPRLEEERLAALEDRIDADLASGRASELTGELRRLVDEHPLRERLRAQQMLALYRTGRQADALSAFQDARRRLVGELGIEPGAQLQQLERQILEQDPALQLRGPRRALGPVRRIRRRTLVLAGAAACLVTAGVVVAATGGGSDGAPRSAAAAPAIKVVADSLVGIDARTGRLVAQYQVGANPDQVAAWHETAWVSNSLDRTLSYVDLTTGHRQDAKGFPAVDHVTTTPNGDVFVSSFKHFVWAVSDTLVPQRILRLPGQAEALAFGAGSLWVSSPATKRGEGGDQVVRYDPGTARIAERIPVGDTPIFITFGFGRVWVSNYDGDSVSVITPGQRTARTIPLGDGPLGIASGEGAVWVVLYGERELLRLNPETGKVAARIPVGDGPQSVAAAEGSVWVTNREDGTVTQIDPDTNRVVRTIDVQMPPYGVAVTGGRAWVTIQASAYP